MLHILIMLVFFVFVVFTHVQWCRANSGKDLQITPFIVYSVAGLALYLTGVLLFLNEPLTTPPNVWSIPLQVTAIVIYLCLSVLYLMFYFGTNVESPSRRLLTLIDQSNGMTEYELLEHFTNDYLICPRVEDLLRTGFIEFDGAAYRLSKRGLCTAKFLKTYQKLTSRAMGG